MAGVRFGVRHVLHTDGADEMAIDAQFLKLDHRTGAPPLDGDLPHLGGQQAQGDLACQQAIKQATHALVQIDEPWLFVPVKSAINGGCWSCLATWGLADPAHQLVKVTHDFVAGHPSDVLRLVRGDG